MKNTQVKFNENDVFHQLFWFRRLLALPNAQKLNTSYSYLFHVVGMIFLLLVLFVWSLFNKCKAWKEFSSLSVFVFEVVTLIILTLFSLVTILFTNFLRRKSFKVLMENLTELDHLMNNLQFRKRRKCIFIELVTVHLVFVFLYIYDIYTSVISFESNTYIFKIPDFINQYVMTLEVVTMCNYAQAIKCKFKALNLSLKKYVKSSVQNSSMNCDLDKYMDMHSKLCSTISTFNDCFGVQILGVFFVGLIATTYGAFIFLLYASGNAKISYDVSVFYRLMLFLIFICYFMLLGIIITVSCVATAWTGRHTATVCYKQLLQTLPFPKSLCERTLKKELLALADQVSQRQINFTACRFLTIDFKTLCTLFGSTAMNVIILLQFKK
ncbi:gustatory receptor 92 [Tribolium castaneum]|uniref:Gustatory receptor n=1 Tax=Tribolium castaneum TaxID=7070 RepID=D7EHV7_TRICA|nr:gustatory receptor 92 [Tribolium castaneum]